jgi:hypothetical protein
VNGLKISIEFAFVIREKENEFDIIKVPINLKYRNININNLDCGKHFLLINIICIASFFK